METARPYSRACAGGTDASKSIVMAMAMQRPLSLEGARRQQEAHRVELGLGDSDSVSGVNGPAGRADLVMRASASAGRRQRDEWHVRGSCEPQRVDVGHPRHDHVWPQGPHDARGFLEPLRRSHRKPQLRKNSLAPQAAVRIVIGDQDERRKPWTVFVSAAAAGTGAAIRTPPLLGVVGYEGTGLRCHTCRRHSNAGAEIRHS